MNLSSILIRGGICFYNSLFPDLLCKHIRNNNVLFDIKGLPMLAELFLQWIHLFIKRLLVFEKNSLTKCNVKSFRSINQMSAVALYLRYSSAGVYWLGYIYSHLLVFYWQNSIIFPFTQLIIPASVSYFSFVILFGCFFLFSTLLNTNNLFN